MEPAASTAAPQRRYRAAYFSLLAVLPFLCAALVMRLLDLKEWNPKRLALGLYAAVAFAAIKCIYDLFNKKMDTERRLLSIAAFVPVSLFLISFDASAAVAPYLLGVAIVALVTGLGAALLVGRKKLDA
jgi:predicted CDP-diglyceride synthetase/phosphatidate cytidylyltransferase